MSNTYTTIPASARNHIKLFDINLSRDLLKHITQHVHELPEEDQLKMASIFNGAEEMYTISPILEKLFSHTDLIARTIQATNSKLRFQVAVIPSLMIWFLNQGCLTESSQKIMIQKCVSHCIANHSCAQTIVSATHLMAQLAPLIPNVPENVRALFLENVLHKIYEYANPWNNPSHPELSIHYLTLAHQISSSWNGDSTEWSMLNTWHQKVVMTVFEAGHKNNRAAFGNWLATCTLPLKDRLNALQWCNSEIWTLPSVIKLLLPSLPKCEYKRLNELPWATLGENTDAINQTLVRTYCPISYPLIELAARENDWDHRTKIATWAVRTDTPEPETFALPHDYI